MRPWFLSLVGLGVLAACAATPPGEPVNSGQSSGTAAVHPDDSMPGTLPEGWRWESYGEAAVGVPEDWGQGVTDQAWCAQFPGKQAGDLPPYVGRPGPIFAIGCPRPQDGVDPGALVENGGTFVWFDDVPEDRAGPRLEGDRATVLVGHVRVRVQAHERLRARILATVRHIDGGINGCPLAHPVAEDFTWRPSAGTPVERLTGVRTVSACKYNDTLLSSVRVTGHAAGNAVDRIAEADRGGGPNSPNTCVTEEAYGEEVILLRIRSDQGLTELVMRYSGCDHHGFDDGHSVRELTRDAAAPFVAGPNAVKVSAGNLRLILH